MRSIGDITNQEQALRFGDYLEVKNIRNEVEEYETGRWTIWIHADKHLPESEDALKTFLADPDAAEFQGLDKQAEKVRRQLIKEEEAAAKRNIDGRKIVQQNSTTPAPGPITMGVIGICVLAALATKLGMEQEIRHQIMGPWLMDAAKIKSGEVWRLLTPCFLHGGFIHLLFNMWAMFHFGSLIEARRSSLFLLIAVLVTGIGSNAIQLLLSGPAIGLSGVVYGLFGFCWAKTLYDRSEGIIVTRDTIFMLIIWLGIGFLNRYMRVANVAHLSGLGIGFAWAYIESGHWRRFLR